MNGRRPRNRNNRKSHIPNRNQVYESSGPENKVRGTAQQIFEKYQALARDALSSGNLVQAEAFHQHGEHYLRLHNIAVEAAAEAQERRQQQQQERRDARNDGGDRQDKQGERNNDRNNDRQNDRQNDRRRDRRDRKDRPGAEARERNFDADEQAARATETNASETGVPSGGSQPGNETQTAGAPASATVDPSEMDQPDLGQMPAFLSDKLPLPGTGEAPAAASSDSGEEKPAPKRRGRPPKAKPADAKSTDAESSDKPAPKRRGRPPKAKVAEESGDGSGSGDGAGNTDGSGGDLSDAA